MSETKRIAITVNSKLARRASALAKERDLTLSKIAEAALREFVAKEGPQHRSIAWPKAIGSGKLTTQDLIDGVNEGRE